MPRLRSWNVEQKPAVGTEKGLPVKQEKNQESVMSCTHGGRVSRRGSHNGVECAEHSSPMRLEN